jgi:sugar phosphate isomerase/epimerase
MRDHFFLSHLCASSLLWRNHPIEAAARAMMRLQLRHLDLAAEPLAPRHYQADGNNSRLFNILAEAGVSVAVLRLTGMSYAQKIRAIADAGERGIPAVIDRVERLTLPDLVDRIRLYALCAARAGVQLILENDSLTSCDSAVAQTTLAHFIQQPALGFGFAPPHAMAYNRDPAEEVRLLGERLRLAYLWDASVSEPVAPKWSNFPDGFECAFDLGPPEDQAPGHGRGRMDWSDYFTALTEVGFRGIFNLNWAGSEAWSEGRTEEAIARAIQFCGGHLRQARMQMR